MTELTKQDIIAITGPLNDRQIVEIVGTGASRVELEQAYAWLSADDAISHEHHRRPEGRVARLCEILGRRETQTDEDRTS